jgi:hypothetical protein
MSMDAIRERQEKLACHGFACMNECNGKNCEFFVTV